MPQSILPLFSKHLTMVNFLISVQQNDNTVFWFQGNRPVFRHHFADEDTFRLFCSQLINNGNAKASEIACALGVNKEKLSRWARHARISELKTANKKNEIKKSLMS
jgi:hypothetical protein